MDNKKTLEDLRTGDTAVIAACSAGRALKSRFAALGFTPGSTVRVVQNYGRGPLLVEVHGATVALGRGEARAVQVRGTGSNSDE